jgi:hypothetical protein
VIRRRVKKLDLEKQSHLGWNAFIDLIAIENFQDLTDIQKIAHLIFWYDAEVNNGGHLQYFLNSAGLRVFETLDALSQVELECQKAILTEALEVAQSVPISTIHTVDDYIAEATDDKFGRLDHRYYAHQAEVDKFLEEYLRMHFEDFIELT